jgi:hypothetical protein
MSKRWRRIGLILVLCPAMVWAGRAKPCVASAEAAKILNKDICLSVHVYDVVELGDGTRFLDVCPPEMPDAQCRLTIISLKEDRAEVGELVHYRDMDVEIRGIVKPMHGRAALVLSHARQFSGGPPKFRPNPRLLRGFSGDEERAPVRDPNLRPHGGHRSFMNSMDTEARTGR